MSIIDIILCVFFIFILYLKADSKGKTNFGMGNVLFEEKHNITSEKNAAMV